MAVLLGTVPSGTMRFLQHLRALRAYMLKQVDESVKLCTVADSNQASPAALAGACDKFVTYRLP